MTLQPVCSKPHLYGSHLLSITYKMKQLAHCSVLRNNEMLSHTQNDKSSCNKQTTYKQLDLSSHSRQSTLKNVGNIYAFFAENVKKYRIMQSSYAPVRV